MDTSLNPECLFAWRHGASTPNDKHASADLEPPGRFCCAALRNAEPHDPVLRWAGGAFDRDLSDAEVRELL